jgi:hypothetical protein
LDAIRTESANTARKVRLHDQEAVTASGSLSPRRVRATDASYTRQSHSRGGLAAGYTVERAAVDPGTIREQEGIVCAEADLTIAGKLVRALVKTNGTDVSWTQKSAFAA